MIDYQTKDRAEREILEFMKKHPRVTSKDLASACSVGEMARLRAFRSLKRAGIIKYVGRDGAKWVWTIFDLAALQARVSGQRSGKDAAIWMSMRAMNIFSTEDLMISLVGTGRDVTASDIQSYCSALVQSKYLKVLTRARPGVLSARYQLIKNTGPLPPVRKRMTVLVDPNEDRIVYADGERL